MFDTLYDGGSFGGWRKDGADTGSFGVCSFLFPLAVGAPGTFSPKF
jgi:hypothetical protein